MPRKEFPLNPRDSSWKASNQVFNFPIHFFSSRKRSKAPVSQLVNAEASAALRNAL